MRGIKRIEEEYQISGREVEMMNQSGSNGETTAISLGPSEHSRAVKEGGTAAV